MISVIFGAKNIPNDIASVSADGRPAAISKQHGFVAWQREPEKRW